MENQQLWKLQVSGRHVFGGNHKVLSGCFTLLFLATGFLTGPVLLVFFFWLEQDIYFWQMPDIDGSPPDVNTVQLASYQMNLVPVFSAVLN